MSESQRSPYPSSDSHHSALLPTAGNRSSWPWSKAVVEALHELTALTTCQCEAAWTDRGLHDPNCLHDYREDVEILATVLAAITCTCGQPFANPDPHSITCPSSPNFIGAKYVRGANG